MDTRIFADLDALSRAVLDELLKIMNEAVSRRGRVLLLVRAVARPHERLPSFKP